MLVLALGVLLEPTQYAACDFRAILSDRGAHVAIAAAHVAIAAVSSFSQANDSSSAGSRGIQSEEQQRSQDWKSRRTIVHIILSQVAELCSYMCTCTA
uniref:VAN3-binding protein-like auxin canalisation domain-containing protein n=1 Tax=Setaria viridis TaxID=4556 RepID=A0A4U6TMQ5_SETVI|nr:hypothetical protein SEVIR_7G078600v2 [Setaria viridis]